MRYGGICVENKSRIMHEWQVRRDCSLQKIGEGGTIGFARSSRRFPPDQRGVAAAEAEGVGDGDADRPLLGGVGDVAEVAIGIGLVEVDRRGNRMPLDGARQTKASTTTAAPGSDEQGKEADSRSARKVAATG